MVKPKYKAVKRLDQRDGQTCTGCAGSFSDAKCLEISEYVKDKDIPSCVGSDGVIYVEVKK